jgi:hypothetical protein
VGVAPLAAAVEVEAAVAGKSLMFKSLKKEKYFVS